METIEVYTDSFLNDKRVKGDAAADTFVSAIFADELAKSGLRDWLATISSNNSLNKIPEAYTKYNLMSKVNLLPGWADKKLMKAGADFFAGHADAIMNLLGLLSLPYCYAAAKGAMVLHLSDRIKSDTGKRLMETAEFVWDVMAPDAFENNGKGFAAILKVRLMHAAARFYTLKSGKWDMAMGTPVNQEDMAGTNLSFSLIVIRGLRKFGFQIRYEDQQAVMHLWNVIGYLLGVEVDLLPQNGKNAFNLEEAIRKRHFEPSVHGRALTDSLVKYFHSVNTGETFSSSEIVQVMRYLLGNGVADILGIGPTTLPPNKILLLRTANGIKDLMPGKNLERLYKERYIDFLKQKKVLLAS